MAVANVDSLKIEIAKNYQKNLINYFEDEKKATRFLSTAMAYVQRNPKLLECEPLTLINAIIMMAEIQFMPSDVSGEAYIIPYKGKAQLQLGYQGLVTLFYRAGVRSIAAEIVYKNDKFSYKNGVIEHEPDVFSDRGEAIGAYVIAETQSGGKIAKVMKKQDIMAIGKKFSKSFNSSMTPWKEENDPELWMWKKTVLKQAAKLIPKNEQIYRYIAEDNKDSNIAERMKKAEKETLKIGNHEIKNNEKAQ